MDWVWAFQLSLCFPLCWLALAFSTGAWQCGECCPTADEPAAGGGEPHAASGMLLTVPWGRGDRREEVRDHSQSGPFRGELQGLWEP